jgi:hypothetical protein
MEKWKPLRASHFSTPPTAAELLTRPLIGLVILEPF